MKTLLKLLVLSALTAFCARAETIHYTYDTAGRLLLADYGGTNQIAYSYDANGNLLRKGSPTAGDSDNDGLDDTWESQHFGSTVRDGTGDFDHDGMSDLAEFLAGTSPTEAASALKVTRITTDTGVSATIEWSAVSGKTYRVQYKDALNLNSWTDLPGDVPANGSTASKMDNTVPSHVQRYYRVILVGP
jgi:YD repeat-containing protein